MLRSGISELVSALMERESSMKIIRAIKIGAGVLGFVLLLAAPLFSREDTDVIVMKNGDRLTGKIKGLNAGVLYISLPYILGTSEVEWEKVARLESTQLFLVRTEDGLMYTGKLATTNTPGTRPLEIQIAQTSGKEVVIDSSRIIQMNMTSEKFFQRFNGSINSGIVYSKGNESTQYSLGTEITYPRERWGAAASVNSTLSSSSGASASTRNQFDFSVFRLLRWNNWFYDGLGTFLQSSEQGIIAQGTFGGGVGRYLKNSNTARISLLAGLAWQNTAYEKDIAAEHLASCMVAANLQFFRFNKTTASVTAALFPALSEPGRVKFNTNATYYLKIRGNLSWNVSFYGSWDNRPPAGLSGSDYGTSSGLSLTFGNR
jgi:Protein of unknown function, DUF481